MITAHAAGQQVQLAEIVTSLFRGGHVDVATDIIVLTSSYNGTHVLFDDTNMDSIFMKTLHELLDNIGFSNIMKVSKEKANKLAILAPALDSQYPNNISPIRQNI